MSVDFTEFDIAELQVLDAKDALGLPEMGASISINYAGDMDEMLGDEMLGDVTISCSCCCCC